MSTVVPGSKPLPRTTHARLAVRSQAVGLETQPGHGQLGLGGLGDDGRRRDELDSAQDGQPRQAGRQQAAQRQRS